MIGKQILNYKIIREIGSGGMATVYEAAHTTLNTKVAIKVLKPALTADEGIRQRFTQEAKIMASLNHDGITKVIDFDNKDNQLSIVMEYLDGQTLDEYINQKGALKEEEAMTIFLPILEAFSYAHSKGIVHRDVKPSNIFITTEGKVKIMDFGIAKLVEDGAKVLTQTGTQMGTPVYMSPEQVHDSKHIDHRTDIYSLGVTLWFMLEGKPPYDADNNSSFDIFKKIDSEPLPELTISPILSEKIQKATEKERKNRFDSCNEFVTSLQNKVNRSDETVVSVEPVLNETIEISKIKNADKSDTTNSTKITNNNYLIFKLIGVSVLGILLNKIFHIDSLLHYPIGDDGYQIPIVYFSSLLIGIGWWFILKNYVTILYLISIIIFSLIPYYYLPDFLGIYYLYTITETAIQYLALKKKNNNLLLKWIFYAFIPIVSISLISRYLVEPGSIYYDRSVELMIIRIFNHIVISIFLGLFFITEFPKLNNISKLELENKGINQI